MLKLSVLGLAVAVFCLTSPCQALIDPAADVLYHPSGQTTAETTLTGQIQVTALTVSGAYSGPGPAPTPADYYSDSHTVVFEDLKAGANGIFELQQFDPTRTLPNGNPVGQLQGLLLYFTVHLKSGRQVFDNETDKAVTSALLEIGTSLNVWSRDQTNIKINCLISPSATASGSLGADLDGPDFPTGFPKPSTLTQAEIDAYSTGLDRLAAIIDPSDPSSTDTVPNEIFNNTDPAHAAILAAFTGTGKVAFNYTSLLNTFHQVSSQGVIGWTVSPLFDVEARVVYLYAAVPEPASMGLLAAAFAPLLARRLRKRKTRLA